MRRLEQIEPWLWGFAFSTIAFAQALWDWDKAGWGDWGQFHHWWEVGRVAILRHGEFPLWDPHHCGGVSMWGQPQSQHLAPTWWVTGLAFGTVAGHKLFILLHSAAGFAGMVRLARRYYGLRTEAAYLAAITFAFSGFFAWRAAGGHSTFLGFLYLPWIFYFWRKTNDDVRYAGGVAGLMALTLLEGGTYPFPLIFLLLAFDFCAQLLRWRPRWAVIRTGLITGTLTAMIGAIRLWPVYLTMSRFPRNTEMEDSQTFEEVLHSLTARAPHDWYFGHRWVWAEYSAHIGWVIIGLSALGALVALRPRARLGYLVAGALVFTLCAMGNVAPHYPWPLLHELPLYENFHVPSRFHVLVTFYLCLLAALALDRWLDATTKITKRRWTRRIPVALAWLVVLGAGGEVISNSAVIANRWDGREIYGVTEDNFHLVGPAGYLDQYMSYPLRNVGTRACYDPVPWTISPALWVGDQPQARIDPRGTGEVTGWGRTNHTLWAEVTLTEPGRVVFNQNYDPDWRVSVGEAAEDDHHRLVVDLPAGTHRVDAWFAPSDLPWSIVVCLAGILLSLLLLLASPLRLARLRRSTSRRRLGNRGR